MKSIAKDGVKQRLILALMIGIVGSAHAQPTDAERISALETRLAQLETTAIPAPASLQAAWQNGLRFNSADNNVRLQLGGRIQNDWAVMSGDDAVEEKTGELKDGTKFRRARLNLSGTIYEYTSFKFEFDFAGGSTVFRDVWVGLDQIPYVGTIRIGKQLEPFSFEQMSGNNYHQFMERGLPAAFYPFRATGITAQNTMFDQRATWGVGFFIPTDNSGDSNTNSEHSVSARLTALPLYSEDGSTWVHLGLSVRRQATEKDRYSVSTRPESSIAPIFLKTSISTDEVDMWGFEFAATHGPAYLQGEYYTVSADLMPTEDRPETGSVDFTGYYVYAGYFLTGEHRTYNKANGTLSRVKPKSNFRGQGHGWGAWEIAVRHSELDLNDGATAGGLLQDYTAGVNWYLNPNLRFMLNYVHADMEHVGTAEIVQLRAQVDF